MTIPAGTRLGPYEILSPLGAGGMGEVYRARDTRLGRDVAVKVLPQAYASDADRLRRFEQEARAAGQLDHPTILVVHDAGTHAGSPYIVTELLEGETLRSRLGGAALPARKAIEYALQIARGLAAAHERRLTHRDLKPENLFVLRDGRVKILDFGIAKLTRPDEPRPGRTAGATKAGPTMTAGPTAGVDTDPGMVMGTAGYMAPEQVRGQPADHRSDIFAFGAILYEMLSGRRAFHGGTSAETMTAILREEPPEIARDDRPVPPALERIVRHCLEKSPAERFQSASDVAFALEALSGLSDSGPKPAVPAGRGARRFLVPAISGLAILAAGILAGQRTAKVPPSAPASYQKLTFRRGPIHAARFSIDGQSIFCSASWDGQEPEILTCDTKFPGSASIGLSGSYLLDASASNELAILIHTRPRPHFMALGTLARVSPAGGAPREVLENVQDAAWSPDGSKLAVVHVVGNLYRLEYPIGNVLYESTGWITHMRISPKGDRIAFLDHTVYPDDRGSVVAVDLRGRARTLSAGWGSAQGLAWSSSGDEVWFSAAREGSIRSLYAVSLGGRFRAVASLPGSERLHDISRSGDVLLTSDNDRAGIIGRGPGETEDRDLTWLDWSIPMDLSTDCKTLLFSEQGQGGGPHYAVCIRGMDGSPPVRLGEGEANDLSPDGNSVLVTRFWMNPPELALLPTGPGEPRTLPPTGLEHVAGAQIFPDGNHLLLLGNEPGHGIRLWVQDMSGETRRPIAPEGVRTPPFATEAVSPDGKWVVGLPPDGGITLYPVDGGTPRPVPSVAPGETPVGWSADGGSLYVGLREPLPLTIFRIAVATGKRTPWREISGPPDRAGLRVGFTISIGRDERSYAYSYSRALHDLYIARGLR